jgi:trk system potassium uptake protein TrkA
MDSSGEEVVLVTRHERDAEEFALAFPRTIVLHGDARDPGVLRQAHADSAKSLVALTDDDAANLSVCLLAREAFHIPLVAGLVGHPQNARVFHALGIPCISCTEIVADGVMTALSPSTVVEVR